MIDLLTGFADSHPSDTSIVQLFAVIVLWAGGYLAAPMLFMATMGIFRNLAGMGTGSIKALGSKIREPGRKRRAWGKSAREELKATKAQNKGASRWGTRRAKMMEDYRESSRGLETKETLHEDLTTGDPTKRQQRARRGMSEKVLNQARAEQSRDDKSQSMYGIERAGWGVSGETFETTYADGSTETLKKDDVAAAVINGAAAYNTRTGAVLSKGEEDEAAQRGMMEMVGQQALVPPIRKVQAEIQRRRDASEKLAQGGDMEGAQREHTKAQQLATVLNEGAQNHVDKLMPKMTSYFKGDNKAFGRIDAGALSGFDPTEVDKMVDWASNKDSFKNEHGTYDAQAHKQAWSRVGQAIQEAVENPNIIPNPETLKETRARLESAPIHPDALSPEMVDAIGRINKQTGVIE